MDWRRVVAGKRKALTAILAELVEMAGLRCRRDERGRFACRPVPGGPADGSDAGGPAGPTLSRYLRNAVLRLLRPAEAAARRLVVVAARRMVAVLPPPRPRPTRRRTNPAILRKGVGTGIVMPRGWRPPPRPPRAPCLPLFDPPWRLPRPPSAVASSGVPRITVPGYPLFPVKPRQPPAPDDILDAAPLARRLAALARALDDLPAQARRLARWRARRSAARQAGRPHRAVPLRPGRAWALPARRRPHAVHDHLADLHYFAGEILRADTS